MVRDGLILFGKELIRVANNVARSARRMIVSMGPIGWTVAIIVAAIVGIGIALANNNETVKKYVLQSINAFISWYNELLAFRILVETIIFFFKSLWETIKLLASNSVTAFSSVGKAIFLALSGKFSEAKDELKSGWDEMVIDAQDSIKEITKAFEDGNKAILEGNKEPWTMGDLEKGVQTVKDKFHSVTGSIKNSMQGVFDYILGKFSGGSSLLSGGGRSLVSGVGGLLTPVGSTLTPTGSTLKPIKTDPVDTDKKTKNQKSVSEWVAKWGTAVNAVKDIFASMFDFISKGYEAQLEQVGQLADKKVASISTEAISEQNKAAKIKKIREKQAKDEAAIKLKMWKADKAAAITSIIISGAMAVASAFAQGPSGFITGPLVAAAVGAQLAVASSTKPPKFADGGIVSARTLAEVGEYSGVESNPEVIAPLDKLKKLIGNSGTSVYVYGEFRQRGSDLVAVINEENTRQNRY